MGPDVKMILDNDQKALIEAFHEFDADILIAGGRYLYPALKSRIPFLDINHERDFGYAGYDGIVELARQLSFSINSPVWHQLRADRPAGDRSACRERGGEEETMATIIHSHALLLQHQQRRGGELLRDRPDRVTRRGARRPSRRQIRRAERLGVDQLATRHHGYGDARRTGDAQ